MLRLALRPTAPLLAAARLRLRAGARDARARATATGASTKNADAEGIAADDEKFMRLALHEATLAAHALEVPVGAVLVEHATGAVLASHHNSTLREEDPTAHAELKCIREGAKKLGSWQKLAETTLYVTLEPCPMCAGGILNARLGAVVWGAPNPLIGADGSWIDLMGDGGAAGCGAEGVCDAGPGEEEEEKRRARGGGPIRPHALSLRSRCAGASWRRRAGR
jgi:tRNA(adenine34) deaminase